MTQAILVQSSKSQRDVRFDILKAIGLFCIILAHAEPPAYIAQLRNFDVPLMVLVSGALFYCTAQNKTYLFFTYIQKRIPRLILPVWCFLTIFFLSTFIVHSVWIENTTPSLSTILQTFLLVGGIKYFWIIRVFVLIAIASPLLLKLYRAVETPKRFLLTLLFIYLCYEAILTVLGDVNIPIIGSLIHEKVLMYVIPYGCLFGLGMMLPQLNKRSTVAILLVTFALFSSLLIGYSLRNGEIVLTQAYKYPPRLFYLSYGIFACMLLSLLIRKLKNASGILTNFVVFVSQSSLWIYLWHVFFLYYLDLASYRLPGMDDYFVATFLGIAFISILVTYGQKQLVSTLIQKTQFGQNYSELLTTMFLR
ncbi:acyltransferase [Oculatella sp. LEGE 06141]|uniref:acyltransferase family protein n=1 Tax=Oculatella sp. LEGE 06141 TaxID=1828648 RepID=UPI001880EFC2|nr:acyltransferase [Oculatella sp. LEGE 06141]MBE9178829.1 acyltransferase [Oculatella sp. LEGE 06141]